MMKWFGIVPFGPACVDLPRVSPPVGEACAWCDEHITAIDEGYVLPHVDHETVTDRPFHLECFVRQVFGSVGHQLKVCACHGGEYEDSPTLTKREAAKAALEQAQTLPRWQIAPYIVCPRCGAVSHHPKDITERYCGRCHRFHDETQP
jgi:hypothetical protein